MLEPVAVIGRDYWPLPWYLRAFEKTGYWNEVPPDLGKMPLVFAIPETEDAVTRALGETHVAVPRGLRAGVPVHLFVRTDVWKLWMNAESR
jgi:predicted membrane-bound mannosyltransferase